MLKAVFLSFALVFKKVVEAALAIDTFTYF